MDHYIPQYLDEPTRYLVFTADELAAIVVPLIAGTFISNFLVGLIAGAICFWILRKAKKGGSLYKVLWTLYWMLPGEVMRLKKMPRSDIRVLVG